MSEISVQRAGMRNVDGYARARSQRYATKQDIVIPAGTEVGIAAWRVEREAPFAEAVIGPTKDTTFEWSMPLDEALELGLVGVVGE